MDDSIGMQILDSHSQLVQIALSLYLSDPFPSLDELIESLMRAEFQENVNVL